jgi:hypothetical protein
MASFSQLPWYLRLILALIFMMLFIPLLVATAIWDWVDGRIDDKN